MHSAGALTRESSVARSDGRCYRYSRTGGGLGNTVVQLRREKEGSGGGCLSAKRASDRTGDASPLDGAAARAGNGVERAI